MPGTTTNYAFRYQVAGDPADGASLGKNLADDVDAALLAQVNALTTALRPLTNQRTAASSAITTTTLVEVLSVTLPAAGTYAFDALVLLTQTVAVGRPGLALGGTSTPTAWRWGAGSVVYNTASGSQALAASGTTYPASTAGQVLTGVDWPASAGYCQTHVVGTVTVSAAGTFTIRLNESAGSGQVTAQPGSMLRVWRTA